MKTTQAEQKRMRAGRDSSGGSDAAPAIELDREALSALLDGELSDFELRRLLQKLPQNEQLSDTWQRYNLARSALQGEPFRRASDDFSARLAAQVALEPPHSRSLRTPATGGVWWGLAGKLTVAASVSAAVFLGMQYTLLQDSPLTGLADTQEATSGLPAVQAEIDAEAQRRLNEYIQSVSIPVRAESTVLDGSSVLDSPLVRPVSDRELIRIEERR